MLTRNLCLEQRVRRVQTRLQHFPETPYVPPAANKTAMHLLNKKKAIRHSHHLLPDEQKLHNPRLTGPVNTSASWWDSLLLLFLKSHQPFSNHFLSTLLPELHCDRDRSRGGRRLDRGRRP